MDIKNIARELGKRGGTKTRDRYGVDHFKELNRRSIEARRKKPKRQDDQVDNKADKSD